MFISFYRYKRKEEDYRLVFNKTGLTDNYGYIWSGKKKHSVKNYIIPKNKESPVLSKVP